MRERARRFARLWYRALAEGLMSLLTVGHGSWRPSPPHGAPRLAARQVRPRATVVCERRRNERRTERTAFGTGRSRHRGKDATVAFGCVALRERHRQPVRVDTSIRPCIVCAGRFHVPGRTTLHAASGFAAIDGMATPQGLVSPRGLGDRNGLPRGESPPVRSARNHRRSAPVRNDDPPLRE